MSLEAMNSALEADELREALRRAQKALLKSKAWREDMNAAAALAARDAVLSLPRPKVPRPRAAGRRTGSAEVGLWHLTDWQGGKLTTSYSSDVMRERVERFVEKALSITEIQRKAHPVNDLVIALGGDMIEGLFNYPAQLAEVDQYLDGQYSTVAALLADVVTEAAANFRSVLVVPEWGNHGRIGSKRAEVPKNNNFDRMIYHLSGVMTRHISHVTWQECPEDIQRLEIGNYRALVIHGDEVGRNGFASPGGIVRHADRWRSGAYPWAFRDVYVGHYHTHAEWPMANGLGSIYQTGSTESDNRYARDLLAATATPSQRLHFIDPEKGRVTSQYKVYLDE